MFPEEMISPHYVCEEGIKPCCCRIMADPKYAGLPGIDTNHPDTYETYSDHEIEGVLLTLTFLRIYTVIFC